MTFDDDAFDVDVRRHAAEIARTRYHPADVIGAGSTVGARTIGLLALVDVGWSVWSRTDGPDMRLDQRGEPRGGVVVEVYHDRDADAETGELSVHRAFRCIDPYQVGRRDGRNRLARLARVTLTEAEVAVDGVEPRDRDRVWRVIVALCIDAARPGQRLDLLRTEHDRAQAIADAGRLVRAVLGA